MSIMSHSLEGFSLPYMKEMSTIQDLDSYRVSFKRWVTYLNNLYKKPNSLAKFFGQTRRQQKGPFTPESLPSNPNKQMKMLALNQETLQHSRYQVQCLTDRIAVLQHEWIRGALYMLAKHNTKFMQDGEYYNIQENRAMKATNRSGERIFSTLNRVLSSHPNVRAPIISGIIKIKALGEALFQEIHDTYASPETWRQARALLDACPRQHTLCKERYAHWTENAGLRQQGRQNRRKQPDPREDKIKRFLSQMGVTVPEKKLTVNFMLNQLRQLKQSSSFLLTIKILLPRRKDDLLYHFSQVIEALSSLTSLPATAGNNKSQ